MAGGVGRVGVEGGGKHKLSDLRAIIVEGFLVLLFWFFYKEVEPRKTKLRICLLSEWGETIIRAMCGTDFVNFMTASQSSGEQLFRHTRGNLGVLIFNIFRYFFPCYRMQALSERVAEN